jgi:hypothetical protein
MTLVRAVGVVDPAGTTVATAAAGVSTRCDRNFRRVSTLLGPTYSLVGASQCDSGGAIEGVSLATSATTGHFSYALANKEMPPTRFRDMLTGASGMPHLQPEKRVKIPVRFVDGTWDFFYGGNIPVITDTIGTLIVERQRLSDPDFLKKLETRTEHQILPPGTSLLVALKVRPQPTISSQLRNHLRQMDRTSMSLSSGFFSDYWRNGTSFVEIKVLPSTPSSGVGSKLTSGGVWLVFDGTEPKGVISGKIELPKDVSPKPVNSLSRIDCCDPWSPFALGPLKLHRWTRWRCAPIQQSKIDIARGQCGGNFAFRDLAG